MFTLKEAERVARYFEMITRPHIKNNTLPSVYIRYICCFFRKHMELLEDAEYRKMYEVIIRYLIAYEIDLCKNDDCHPRTEQEHRYTAELFIDVLASVSEKALKHYSKKEIDSYMAHLKKYHIL